MPSKPANNLTKEQWIPNAVPLHDPRLVVTSFNSSGLFGGEVNLVGRVEAAISCLFTSASI